MVKCSRSKIFYIILLWGNQVLNSILNVKNNLILAICLKGKDGYIGNVYLNNIDFRNRNASYLIGIGEKEYWGRGQLKKQ